MPFIRVCLSQVTSASTCTPERCVHVFHNYDTRRHEPCNRSGRENSFHSDSMGGLLQLLSAHGRELVYGLVCTLQRLGVLLSGFHTLRNLDGFG